MAESDHDYYLRVWHEVLGEILGWSDAQIDDWAHNKWVEISTNPTEAFFREAPVYWVVPELIPESLQTSLNKLMLNRLRQQLLQVFGDDDGLLFAADTDWRPHHAKIQEILAQYGGELPA